MMYSNISWTEAQQKSAWVGFSAGDGVRYTSITENFSISISDISIASNVNQAGVWVFRVDGNSTVSGGE